MNQFQHIRSQDFVALEDKLPLDIRRSVAKQFQLLQTNQSHPSLRFKKCWGDGCSVLHITIGHWDTDMRTRSLVIGLEHMQSTIDR